MCNFGYDGNYDPSNSQIYIPPWEEETVISNKEIAEDNHEKIRIANIEQKRISLNDEVVQAVVDNCPFKSGDKVRVIRDTKVYDFGYIGQKGHYILYNEGERNGQDSFAINAGEVYAADLDKAIIESRQDMVTAIENSRGLLDNDGFPVTKGYQPQILKNQILIMEYLQNVR